MKNKLNRIISSLLILAFLISALTVFASASEDESAGSGSEEAEIEVLLNRTFDEGWNYDNGISDDSKGNPFCIDFEEDSEYNYNYFFRLEIADGQSAYSQFSFGTDAVREGATVIELSIKLDDYADIGDILWAKTEVKQETISILAIKENSLYAFPSNSGANVKLGRLDNDWLELALIFDWGKSDMFCTIKYDKVDTRNPEEVVADEDGDGYLYSKDVTFPYKTPGDVGLNSVSLGFPGISGAPTSLDERIGMSYCIDNYKIYNSSLPVLSEISPDDYGKKVTINKEKPINILSGSGVKSAAQLLEEALCMKVGVDYALVKNEKAAIFTDKNGVAYGAPAVKDGEIMIPLQLLLNYINFPYYLHPDNVSFDITTGTSVTYITVGRDNAKVGDTRVELSAAPDYIASSGGNAYLAIALDDIETLFPGWLVTYDDMGLIIIYEDTTPNNTEDNKEIVNRENDLETMVNIMKKFIFGFEEKEKRADSYVATGTSVYNAAKKNTNAFDHPYILANQNTFDTIKAAYQTGKDAEKYDADFVSYVDTMIAAANAKLNDYANIENDEYKGLKLVPVNPYGDGLNPDSENPEDETIPDTSDGYDPDGGRLDIIGTYTSFLPTVAFAYQITGNSKYVEFAYDWMLALTKWIHWGPGYFLNCAEAAASFGIAYDWLYDGFVAKGYDVDTLSKGFHELTVHDGYVSSNGKFCEHPRSLGDGSIYNTSTNNRNAVCTSGMVIASLALFDYLEGEGRTAQFNEAIYLVGNNMMNLAEYGLGEYAPDGSYIESASYWAYGTNAFFKFVMALDSATGSDYGFMDTWGIDKTCYYACQIASSDGIIWNYHDGGGDGVTSSSALGRVDSAMFNFVGAYLGDPGIVALRQEHLKRGYANVSLYDVIYYPFDTTFEKVELPLDYHMQGIEAFVSRDSWEKGAMYTGIMGGLNDCSHGQVDSGNFIYHNKGIVWFMDLGSDEYNAFEYFGASRYKYYRCNSEGQNLVLMATTDSNGLENGQLTSAGGKITQTFENEHGSYALLDNTKVYGNAVYVARRGILVTNDRQTVVIQDEISIVKVETLYWVAHTAESIEIDDSGRVAYLTSTDSDGNQYTLRAALVAERRSLKFEVHDATKDFILESTVSDDYSEKNGGVPEYSRTGIQRLVVACEDTSIFNMAVVLELVDGPNTTAPVGYEWTNMTRWEPTAPPEVGVESVIRDSAVRADIKTNNALVKSLLAKEDALVDRLDSLYRALTTVAYTFKTFDPSLDSSLVSDYIDHEEYVEIYEDYKDYMNSVISGSNNMVERLLGFLSEE